MAAGKLGHLGSSYGLTGLTELPATNVGQILVTSVPFRVGA